MKNYSKKTLKWVAVLVITMFSAMSCIINYAMATGYGLTMAPMAQSIIVNPGESHKTSFRISNPANSTEDTYYKIDVEPFYQNNDGKVVHDIEGNYNGVVDWVTFDVPVNGKIPVNGLTEVVFTINVPESAPAGGQYFSVGVTASGSPFDEDSSSSDVSDKSDGASITELQKMSHLVYVEVTGAVVRNGEILDANLPNFLLSGNITGTSTVKNTGNVHGEAKYTLKVYPLFSDEPLYTNEENPSTNTVLPDRTFYHALSWDQTPGIGLFNVVYTVEFQGSTTEISKLVIICPLWLLFVIIFAIFLVVFYLVAKAKKRKEN